MKQWLYQHWTKSILFMAIATSGVLLFYLPQMPWPLFLVWAQFPVYLIHEFEEHVFPGKFKEFVNREVFHSKDEDFPLSTSSVFWVNILAIWILFPLGAVLTQNVSLEYGVLLPLFGLFNASLHILFFILKRKYNPGLFVSVFLNYPTGIYTLIVLKQNGCLSPWNVSAAFLVTLLAHALIIILVTKRLRTRSPQA